jgi:carbonic anhydrase
MPISALLERNRSFAATDVRQQAPALPFIPNQLSFVITCIDPRTEPAAILGVELGDAIVERVIGGRVTPAVVEDVAYISYLVETKAPAGPWFDLAVIHHTDCGSGFLADQALRHGFAERGGYDEQVLADMAVTDPAVTVREDVQRLISAPQLSARVKVSGYAYDVSTGLVETVVEPTFVGTS